MSIQNIIFDFGQVMIRFDPAYMTAQYVTDPADAALIEQVVFDRLYWDRLDSGDITDEELLGDCRRRLPERLWQAAEQVYTNWYYHLPPIEGMQELVQMLRQKGFRVLLLSNISQGFADRASAFPLLQNFEGCVFSAAVGAVKPDAAIFRHLCLTYGLVPEECIFIDDSEKNLRGAQAFGIMGYHFDGDAARLRDYLKQLLSI